MTIKRITTGLLYRTATIDRQSIDEEERTVELTFSSESPIERFFGTEILDHSKRKSVRLDRLRSDGALLLNHDRFDPDNQVGAVVKVGIDLKDRVGRATVKFSQSERASAIFQDVVDGIRRSVSVGYLVHKFEEDVDAKEFRATDWEPMEISLVAVPIDVSVGVGRAAAEELAEHQSTIETRSVMEPTAAEKAAAEAAEQAATEAAVATASQQASVSVIEGEAAKKERERIAAIDAVGAFLEKKYPDQGWMLKVIAARQEGKTLEEVQHMALEAMPMTRVQPDSADIGMTEGEVESFQFLRAIRAQAALKNIGEFGREHIERGKFELECGQAAAKLWPGDVQGIIIPADVLRRRFINPQALEMQRNLQVAVGAQGGNLVATDLLGESFIDLLRNNMVTAQAGVQQMDGLVGDIAIPRQTGAGTVYWVGEDAAPTESTQAIGQVTATPKTLGAFTDMNRKLILQSSVDVEDFVRRDFAAIMAIEIDRVVFYGLGAAGEPLGITSVAGLNTTAFSTSATPTWAEVVAQESDIAVDNALMGNLSYITHPTVRGNMKVTSKAGTEAIFLVQGNELNGYVLRVSTQITATHLWLGNWADAFVMRWGGLDLLVDPYTASTTGTIRIVVLQSVDVLVRHGESFSRGS